MYIHPQESWDKAKCERLLKRKIKDGMGTPYPSGYINDLVSVHYAFGRSVKYNGGIVINGKWYEGEEKPLPVLPKCYTIVSTSLGYLLTKGE